jgi:hypothetical protein
MKLILIPFIFIGLTQKVKEPTYVHIGYRDGKPVFNEILTNKIVSLSEDNEVVVLDINTGNGNPKFINECALVTVTKDNKRLAAKGIAAIEKFESANKIWSVSMSDDCKYLAFMSNDSISVFKNSSLVGKFKGGFPRIVGNCVYFNSYENKVDALVDLYKCELKNLEKRELVLSDIFEPDIVVFDGGKYIACAIPFHGELKYCIYNASAVKFRIFEDSLFNARSPIYFPKTKSLYYYSRRKLMVSGKVKYD